MTELYDAGGYMTPDHPDAFLDHPMKEPGFYKNVCPRCKGHGGWNLRANAYPLHGRPDTPENRHAFSHFRCSCNHCNGWGYVDDKTAATCQGHHWVYVENLGRCYNRYKCEHCGAVNDVDSSG